MKRPILLALALASATAPAAAADAFSEMRWQNRVVVLSAADPASAELAEQERLLLSDPDALRERDLVVIALRGDEVSTLFGRTPELGSAADVRRHVGVPAGNAFALRLVGKDGGIKWRREAPASLRSLLGVVDAMPMRRAGRG